MSKTGRFLRSVKHAIYNGIEKGRTTRPELETVYREFFLRELEIAGLKDCFYPVGAAANHGLLYALLRFLNEMSPASVLEFGGGQTTLLLNAFAASNPGIKIVTVEHDESWAEQLRSQVAHEIILAPLVCREFNGTRSRGYDPVTLAQIEPGELSVVDGPIGGSRLARLGCLDVLARQSRKDFAVIVDDTQRHDETEVFYLIEACLREHWPDLTRNEIKASKAQRILLGGRYRRCFY